MKNSKRLAAFLLVAALMAGLLAGCGSTEGEQATDAPGQEATGLVWTSEFTDLGSAAGYVSSVSFAGGKFYFNTSDTTRRHSALLRSSGAWTPPPAR